VKGYDPNFKMAPPLRSERDMLAVRAAVASGLIDLIATDHAPHGIIDKAVEFDQAANGIIGLQTAIPVTLELVEKGFLPLERWVEAWTSKPAKLLGIPHGALRKGDVADITLIDPTEKWTFAVDQILSKSRNSPFIGTQFKGRVKATLVSGRVVYELGSER
jgi:dihydroorotase